ncbi:MAG: peptide chain release factor 1 [candidate division WS1 bacterium]|jgi:peptide chain release factor 1|nr:peptide chain release factor 1 [candidate division WS1 bacterium]
MDLLPALERLEAEYQDVEQQLTTPEVLNDSTRLRELSMRHSELVPAMEKLNEYRGHLQTRDDAAAMLDGAEDAEMRSFLQAELDEAEAAIEAMEHELLLLLIPPDPMRNRNAIVEIRAGTGGDEAALFAGDLYTMYNGYVARMGWNLDVISVNEGAMGGYKEIIFNVQGQGAFGLLKHESGVHRVQRVPATESQGRIHTSAATVAVLPEAEELDVEINPGDLEWDTFRAGGPGGQSMQKNETAVRVTHTPTGLVAASRDERSQLQNREKALTVLRARLYEHEQQKQMEAVDAQRRQAVKSGDRSEKVRTYNYPQDRVTDHRIGMSIHNIPAIMIGEIDSLIEALSEHERQQRLEELAASL